MTATIPLDELLFGVDIASYQGYPDMPQLEREGHSFAFSKVTGEYNYVNAFWLGNREAVRKTRMLFGTYDWVEPQSVMTGAEMAIDYWRVINYYGSIQPGEFVLVDYETPDWFKGSAGHSIEPKMREYFFTLSDLAKQKIGIYTARYFLEETGADQWTWLNDPRFFYWQAAPGINAMMPDNSFWPATTSPFTKTIIHQHQWHAVSTAVSMEFDRNRFWGSFADLLRYGKPSSGDDHSIGDDVKEPPAGKVSAYVNSNNEPIFVWNGGGQTRRIEGVNIQDIGMSVESFTEPGVILDISIQNNKAGDYHERPAPAAFVADPKQLQPQHSDEG
jgi:hypothetical protein